jgi:Holliday junction resolvasome RuvABC endonuclease subunit
MKLFLDLGTKTGYAMFNGGSEGPDAPRLNSGTFDFSPKRYEGGGMRYLRFEQKLTEIFLSGDPESVHFEEVRRHNSTDAAHVYGGLMATLTKFCEERSIPYSGVPVGTIKKFATGKGNANKEAVIAAVKARGYAPGDDNEADAIALALTVLGGGI